MCGIPFFPMSFSPFRLKPTILVMKAPSPRSSAVTTRNALASADSGTGSHRWNPWFMTVNISRRSNVECFSRNSLACGARLVPFYLSDRVQSADKTGTRARRLFSVVAAYCTSPNLDLFKPVPDRSCADEMAKPLYGQHPVRALLALRHVLLDFRPRWILTQSTILVAFKIVSRNVSQVSRPFSYMRRTLSYPLTAVSILDGSTVFDRASSDV